MDTSGYRKLRHLESKHLLIKQNNDIFHGFSFYFHVGLECFGTQLSIMLWVKCDVANKSRCSYDNSEITLDTEEHGDYDLKIYIYI